ncbi:pyridoxamine 5'-phosphate oxidase [Microbacterium pseudoresistens]|uniref:Pyridoxamine 5'-phosphate oxidase n=1 Tax=Microbacterium pseudoresistens TaxID=640634 RepID=A0A7Y9JME8_9MICO|nr:pyridoxamine 5'-phosphate oxidase family protein [Microbacterium pseudoresistens]NYD54310.1 pyridoxamine 5'-phosphate oxidase [Microbacterium pseudoresistens]
MAHDSLAAWLRAQPTLTGTAPDLDLDALPDDPVELFLDWMRGAVAQGVPEAAAATLATIGADGVPDVRTLILKDVDARGWVFASTRSSVKATQLAAAPVAALNFWWPPILRAVRVRGAVVEASAEDSAADLAARSAAARAIIAPGNWVLWRIVPAQVEFWQGAEDRHHTRIIYRAEGAHWVRTDNARDAKQKKGQTA